MANTWATQQAAQQYYNTLSPEEKQKVDGIGGPSIDWFTNAVNAGVPDAVRLAGGKSPETPGWEIEGGYTLGAGGNTADWLGKRTPTPSELRQYVQEQGWSEDFGRYSDRQVAAWLQNWDQGANRFRNDQGQLVDKPTETLGGGDPSSGGGGGMGSGGFGGASPYGGSYGTAGGVPQFNWTKFEAPNPEDVYKDPSYQFRLGEGTKAIEGSAAAKGLLRSGGTLKDLAGYGQDLASQEYGNMFNRELQGWGANYQGEKDAFAPQYGAWETMYGGDLSRWTTGQNAALQKYLQREGNIYGLLNPSIPSY